MGSRGLLSRGVTIIAVLGWAAACSRSDAAVRNDPDPKVEAVREQGRALFFGRAGCTMCHRVGDQGQQIVGPNLGVGDDQTAPVGLRVRHDDLRGIEYVVESIVDPDAFVVAGYARSVMKRYEEPPIALTDEEIVALAAFLAGQGPGVSPLRELDLSRARQRVDVTRRARQARLGTPP